MSSQASLTFLLVLLLLVLPCTAFLTHPTRTLNILRPSTTPTTPLHLLKDPETESKAPDVDDTVASKGLEFALFKSATSKDKEGPTPGFLLKKYGTAYLCTSIPLALLSFGTCYLLVSNGIDVTPLITKLGLTVNDNTELGGNVAIAYAAHKALSPVRFPPTVALTPVVAGWLGTETSDDDDVDSE
ncbi:hypothetical protein TL16_g03690 [Triparma laevis f. inornata]|uniref:DUF1279 domain-containing protein n=2 Tax=Triparma laevis TaxID=1534972 RepID=A0A9W7FKR3_9STRA|nr:hypothetical protein TL16_g03690 [Triparma laevis f. inornata]GMI13796.1 hypothetical protein TrLO_g922 [Triparma laevis f. longispina]